MDQRGGSPTGLLVAGIVLVVVGGLALLWNAGVALLHWWFIWPVLLIVLGAVVLAAAFGWGRTGTGARSVSLPRDTIERLELSMRIGAGRYRLAAGQGSSLLEASCDQPTIAMAADRAGGVGRVRLSTAIERWSWGWGAGHTWTITVAPGVPTSLDVQAGAGDFALDLSGIAITSARLSIGAAELSVVLPRPRGEVPVRVEGGAASMTFQVPAGVEARVSTTGLVAASGPAQTPGYATAADRVTVQVTGGIASVRVVPIG